MKPTGKEIAEADIEAAWEATASLKASVVPLRSKADGERGAKTIPWYEAPSEPAEQLDLFAAA